MWHEFDKGFLLSTPFKLHEDIEFDNITQLGYYKIDLTKGDMVYTDKKSIKAYLVSEGVERYHYIVDAFFNSKGYGQGELFDL